MKNQKFLRVIVALSMALVLMLSCFSIGVLADTTAEPETTVEATGEAEASGNESETASPEDTDGETGTDTSASTTDSVTTGTSTGEEEEKSYLSLIVTLVVVVIIVAVALIYYFKNPEKVQKFWKGYKGELHKIVWLPKDELKRNTIVVCVIVVISVVLIALLDFVFSNVVWFLMELFMN